MRRSAYPLALIISAVLAMASAATPTPAAARQPIALGISTQDSTNPAVQQASAAMVGVEPALWTIWSTWGDRAGLPRCTRGHGTCAFPVQAAQELVGRGITPIIMWQPTNPSDPGAGSYERLRLISSGLHDRYIRAWAKAAAKVDGPVIVRFAHEMNGTWFPWSITNFDNTPALYREAWRHIVDIFRSADARNVRFLWSPFQYCTTCSPAAFEEFYPGNGWVDYVGVTALNWGGVAWTPLDGLVADTLRQLRELTRTERRPLGKPVILPEVASNWDGDKAGWIRDGYAAVYQRWRQVKAIVYFDYDMTFAVQPDWRLIQPSDGSALTAYQALAADPAFQGSEP
jgi:hypothetical protein